MRDDVPMRLVRLWRYPVKSLQGEPLSEVELDPAGVRGDRCWGIRDENTGRILTARRAPQLLFASATLAADGTPRIALPDGTRCDGPGAATDAALSAWLGKPVRLVTSVGEPAAEAEYFADATDDSSEALEWTMPVGRFVDASPVLMLTTASIRTAAALHQAGDWEPRRFRANLLVEADGDGWPEDAWCGTALVRIGDARLAPQQPCVRCTMVTRPQPGIDEDRDIFRTLARHHGGWFGVWSAVAVGGRIAVGDDLAIEPLVVSPRRGDEVEVTELDPA